MNFNTARFLTNPYLLLTLTALFWSGNMVLGRGIRADVPPMALAFWRWAIAFALVLPLALPHLKEQWPLLKKGWKPVLILGLIGVGGYNTFAYLALQYTSATNAVLLNSFIPVATIAISWAFLGKHLRRLEGLGVIISLCGALTIVARGDLNVLCPPQPQSRRRLDAARRAGLGHLHRRPGLATERRAPDADARRNDRRRPGRPAPGLSWEMAQGRHINVYLGSLASLAYVGIFPSFLGYIFYNRGVAEVGASKASLFIHLMPVFGTLLSAIFLGEIPLWYHYLGIGLIFSGIWLTMKK
jgi:drug/metabolite transporter (DMT)-like permease